MSEVIDMSKITKADVKGLECVFATYASNVNERIDALIIKENVHLKDGRVFPNIRIIKDKEWPFYITRKGFQNHQEQKEAELIERLQKFSSTRLNLPKKIMNALNIYSPRGSLRDLSESPYLYGTDILPTSLIKHEYQKKWTDCKTMSYNVAALDTETDVEHGTNEVIIANITYKGKTYSTVTEKFVNGNPNFIEDCFKAAQRLAKDDFDKLEWVIEIVDNPGEACYRVIQKAHEWKPDFVDIWNMNFDIPKMVEMLERYGYDLADTFSDPKVPPAYRFFEYREGPAIKKTQSGKSMSIHHADRWHRCTCPASFYFIDSMCLYKRIRVAAGNEPSYSLNAILASNKLESKLKLKELEDVEKDGDVWHFRMQRDYKPEYMVYNVIDDQRLLDLDAKTGDISRAFPALAGISDFSVYHKNPRKIVDDLHFFYLERGQVFASTSPSLDKNELDKHVVGMKDWIVTLPSYTINNGMFLFKDAPHIRTMIYRYLADLDISGTYPNEEDILNISKATTAFETCRIQGFKEQEQRYFGLTLTGGKSNALELAIRYGGYPTPEQLLEQFDKDHSIEGSFVEKKAA